jgi:Cu+-exporting ATPase
VQAASNCRIEVRGMTCAACVARVERSLLRIDGVRAANINLATGVAHIELTPDRARPSLLVDAIERAGFGAMVQAPESTPSAQTAQSHLDPEGLAALAAMLLSAPLLLPMLAAPLGLSLMLPGIWQLLLSAPVQFVLGARFYRAAWRAARAASGNMDLLIALGSSAAWGLSAYTLWAHEGEGDPHLYFEAASVVIAMVLLGKWLEGRARRGTANAVAALRALRPDHARVDVDSREITLPLSQVRVGDRVIVWPGERIGVDGLIDAGSTHIDESMLTGESRPISRGPGDPVRGGSINGDGRLAIRVTTVGADTVLSRLISLVEEAQAKKAPVQRLVDRVSGVFVPVVLVLAALSFVGWGLAAGDWASAMIHAVAVLVIACPCALGLATPLAVVAGVGVAARHGILIKDPRTLEVAPRVSVVAFDKTGTLTRGEPQLLACETAPGADPRTVLSLAGVAQSASEHPLARAIRARPQAAKPAPADPAVPDPVWTLLEANVLGGRGIVARVGKRSSPAGEVLRVVIGNPALMQQEGIGVSYFDEAADRHRSAGHTVSYMAAALETEKPTMIAGGPAALKPPASGPQTENPGSGPRGARAMLVYGDTPRPGAAQAIAQLRALGIRSVIISGDHAVATQALASAVGCDESYAQILPEGKSALVAELRGQAPGHVVAMVGDGINDAPALAVSDLGIAMGSGSDVAVHTSDITLLRSDLALVPLALEVAQRTNNRIRQNLFWALVFNIVGIPAAMAGMLDPMLAATAMTMSSLTVVGNALLLSRWRPDIPKA